MISTLEYCTVCKAPVSNWRQHIKSIEHQTNVLNNKKEDKSNDSKITS